MPRPIADNLAGKPLSPCERHCIQLLAEGLTVNQVSNYRSVDRRTVSFQLKCAMQKSGCSSLPQLVLWAYRNDLVSWVAP